MIIFNHGKNWTSQEKDFLINNIKELGVKEMRKRLGRSENAINRILDEYGYSTSTYEPKDRG